MNMASQHLLRALQGDGANSVSCSIDFALALREVSLIHNSHLYSTLTHFLKSWTVSSRFVQKDTTLQLQRAYLRSETMLITYHAWLWLNTIAQNYCRHIFQLYSNDSDSDSDEDDAPESNWLARLTREAMHKIEAYKPRSTLNRKDFFPSLPPISVNVPKPRHHSSHEDLTWSLLYSTLRTWLEYPVAPTSLLQAGFVQILLSSFNTTDILLLQGVWQIYCSPLASLIPHVDRRRTSLGQEDLASFHKDLTALPVIADPTSSDAAAFQRLKLALHQLSQLSSQPVHLSTVPAPRHIPQAAAAGLEKLLQFIMDCYGSVPHLQNPALNQEQLTPIQRWCLQDQDCHLPFRELAAGRHRIMSARGPGHVDNIDRPGALASIFVHRGITFSCAVSHEEKTFFTSLEDFEALVARCRSSPDPRVSNPVYICNQAAYGYRLVKRSEALAPSYFKAEAHYRSVFADEEKEDFMTAYRALHRGVDDNKKRLLPIMGELICFLLAGDLYYSGQVAAPSAEDIGTCAAQMQKGAVNGLRLLHIVANGSDKDGDKAAFILAHSHLQKFLSEEVKSAIQFDPIMVEHSLCKVKRFYKK